MWRGRVANVSVTTNPDNLEYKCAQAKNIHIYTTKTGRPQQIPS